MSHVAQSLQSLKNLNNIIIKHPALKDFDEFADYFRRFQLPHYEEARRNFRNHNVLNDYDDANEILPYTEEHLLKIINDY